MATDAEARATMRDWFKDGSRALTAHGRRLMALMGVGGWTAGGLFLIIWICVKQDYAQAITVWLAMGTATSPIWSTYFARRNQQEDYANGNGNHADN